MRDIFIPWNHDKKPKRPDPPMSVVISPLPATIQPILGKHILRFKPKEIKTYTHGFPSGNEMLVREYKINVSSMSDGNSEYCILLSTAPNFPSRHSNGAVMEVLIDGIRHGTFLLRPEDCDKNFYLEGRRISKDEVRCFQFRTLKVDDYMGDYKQPKELLEQSPFWLDSKKEVGTIRVNIYYAWDLKPRAGTFEGMDDYEPCDTVDQIGHIKLGEHIKFVTGLHTRKVCQEARLWDATSSTYPFYSFVIKYGLDPEPSYMKALKTKVAGGAGKQRERSFTNRLANLAEALCFSRERSKLPGYGDYYDSEEDDPAPRYSEKSSITK